jgi:CheY-like chemotaxis protein
MISALEKLSWPKRYGAGAALATAALILQWRLSHWVQRRIPFLLFIPTVALCAALLGQVPAITVFLAGLVDGGMVLAPPGQPLAESLPDRIPLLAYAAASLFFMLDGEQAGKMALRAAHTEQALLEELSVFADFGPGIVLLDAGMPCLSGIEVARRIRATAAGRNVKLVAITGWGQSVDRASTMAAGFDDHLAKPVDAARLRTPPAGSRLKTESA